MQVYGTIPVQPVKTVALTDDPAQAIRQFQTEHPTARVEQINGAFIRGLCACGTPIFEHTKLCGFNFDTRKFTCPICLQKESKP